MIICLFQSWRKDLARGHSSAIIIITTTGPTSIIDFKANEAKLCATGAVCVFAAFVVVEDEVALGAGSIGWSFHIDILIRVSVSDSEDSVQGRIGNQVNLFEAF